MCSNHRVEFDNWKFFIRFQPATKQYILVHYDSYGLSQHLEPFHGKAIALNINDQHAPIPVLFLIHEYMVRGRNFYQPTPIVEVTNDWQDWIINDGLLNVDDEQSSFSFKHETPAHAPPGPSAAPHASTVPSAVPHASSVPSTIPLSSSRTFILPPTADLVKELLEFQRTMPSWKRESMGWEGTAEENIKKYVENVGVESHLPFPASTISEEQLVSCNSPVD